MTSLQTKKLSILVVDDENLIRGTIKHYLLQFGYRVKTVESAKQAIECLKHEHYDVLLTDYYMPVMDGNQLTDYVKINHPNIRIILMTGGNGIGIIKKCHVFLPKPFVSEELQGAIEKAINYPVV